MYNSNVFKLLSISLFLCPLFSSAMKQANNDISIKSTSKKNKNQQSVVPLAPVNQQRVNQNNNQKQAKQTNNQQQAKQNNNQKQVAQNNNQKNGAKENVPQVNQNNKQKQAVQKLKEHVKQVPQVRNKQVSNAPQKNSVKSKPIKKIRNSGESILDLHGLSLKEAKEEVIDFIKEQYNYCKTECTIITGRGNHTNANGSSGVLKQMLPVWVWSDELKHYIKSIRLGDGGGIYKIILIEPTHITLTSETFEDDVEKVIWFIIKQHQKGRNRLQIIHDNQTAEYIDKVLTEAMYWLSRMLSSPKLYDCVFTPSEHYLIWYEEEESSDEESGLTYRVKGPNVTDTVYHL